MTVAAPGALNVVEPLNRSTQVFAVIEAFVRGIETRRETIAFRPAAIVLRVGVLAA